MKRMYLKKYYLLPVLISVLLLNGCARLVTGVTAGFADNLSQSMMEHDDPALIAEAMPAYLLLVDALIRSNPDSSVLKASASKLYTAYAGSFVQDNNRAKRLSQRALTYAREALCIDWTAYCDLPGPTQAEARIQLIESAPETLVEPLYVFASAWLTWIQARSDDWNAIADVPEVTTILERISFYHPDYEAGRLRLYLGVLNTLLPPAFGGKPEVGRGYFEKAIEQSKGRDLMAKVLFARYYARLVFDQALHDQLIDDVLSADPVEPGLTLSNVMAKKQAIELKETSNEYF